MVDLMRFKYMRERAGHTQKSLADKLGVSPSTVSMWERGDRDPDTAMLAKICDLFDCTADYLIGRTKQKSGVILENGALPLELQGLDIKIETVKDVVESGLTERQIKHALWLYKQYNRYSHDDHK